MSRFASIGAIFLAGTASVLAVLDPRVALIVGGGLSAGTTALVFLAWPRSADGAPSDSRIASPDREESDQQPEPSVGLHLGLGLLLRVAVAVFVNYTVLWRAFGPDARAWEMWGQEAARSWDLALTGRLSIPVNPHVVVNGLFSSVLGSSRLPVSVFNGLFGLLLALCAWRMAHELYGRRAGIRSFLLSLYFPSLVLWQSQNLKDGWAQLATAVLALSAVQLGRSKYSRLNSIVLGLAALGLAVATRPYLAVILLSALLISLSSVKLSRLPTAALVGLLAIAVGRAAGMDDVLGEDTLKTIDQARKGLAYGGSAYGQDVDTTTLSGALLYFPEGLTRFLFAPFPWEIDSWLQALALPESLFFLFLSAQAARSVMTGGHGLRAHLVPLSFWFCISSSYALASGNEGTAFRHRAQVVVFVIIMASGVEGRRGRQRNST